MPKEKVAPIIVEDEIVFSPEATSELSSEVAAAISNQEAKKAPTHAELLAYWTPGREKTMEVPALIAAHQTPCATCGASVGYIPAGGDAPPVLICANCG